MKKYILSLGIVLLTFSFNTQAGNESCCSKSDCCKDQKCKTTCAKISSMTEKELASEEGKKWVLECAELCAKNKCCSKESTKSGDQNKKSCCKK